jgi:hypothetical protein
VQRAAGRFAAAEAALADARLAAAFLSDPGVDEALRRESELLQRRRRD